MTVNKANTDYQPFVRHCLRSRWHPSSLDDAATMAQAPNWDWDAVLEVARLGRVTPLLFGTLKGAPWVPRVVLDALHCDYLTTAVRAMRILHELESVLQHLTAADISHIVLKGAALGEALYHNIALRPLGDLDLLVPVDLAEAARAQLEAAGYAATYPEMRRRDLVQYQKEVALTKMLAVGAVTVDLHWRLLPGYVDNQGGGTDWFWETAQPLTSGKAKTLTLGPEAQIVYLATHCALNHTWSGVSSQLLWYMDIAMMMAQPASPLDWTQILNQAYAHGVLRPLQEVISHLVDDWRVPLSPEIVRRIESERVSAQEALIYDLLHTEAPAHSHPGFYAVIARLGSWRDRMSYITNHLFPSVGYMRRRYGVRHVVLLPFAYLYRGLTGLRSAAIVAWLTLRSTVSANKRSAERSKRVSE